jgi:hypothetical protein
MSFFFNLASFLNTSTHICLLHLRYQSMQCFADWFSGFCKPLTVKTPHCFVICTSSPEIVFLPIAGACTLSPLVYRNVVYKTIKQIRSSTTSLRYSFLFNKFLHLIFSTFHTQLHTLIWFIILSLIDSRFISTTTISYRVKIFSKCVEEQSNRPALTLQFLSIVVLITKILSVVLSSL